MNSLHLTKQKAIILERAYLCIGDKYMSSNESNNGKERKQKNNGRNTGIKSNMNASVGNVLFQ